MQIVQQLIDARTETQTCDYKGSIEWPTDAAEAAPYIRDIMAMANTPGGGWLLFGIEDGTGIVEGLNLRQLKSFDRTVIHDRLSRHSSPVPDFHLHKHPADGQTVLALRVEESRALPVVCSLECVSRYRPGELELRRAALYIRTTGAQTKEIDTEAEMRELLARWRLLTAVGAVGPAGGKGLADSQGSG
jgi:predicted HTH transcriptional regulator